MKIYLAGSISNSNWREEVIENFSDISYKVCADYTSYWPTLSKVIFGEHDYVGPYYMGTYDNNTHGAGKHLGDPMACDIVDLCTAAIRKSDLVFAWIDRPDVYGTILEIGIAKGMGKTVVISGSKYYSDMWFVYANGDAMAEFGDHFDWRDNPKHVLRKYLDQQAENLKTMAYKSYLRTPHWRSVRQSAIERHGNKCQICNSGKKLEVHHRTYQRRGEELPEDVVVLCDSCHDIFHTNGKLVKS
jgi:hypothetical protein